MKNNTPSTHFNLKDIKYIKFTPVKGPIEWKYVEYMPPKMTFFGLITKREALKNGWTKNGNPNFCTFYSEWEDWITDEELRKQNDIFQKGDKHSPWYKCARVYIQKRKSYFAQYFKIQRRSIAMDRRY